MDGLQVSGAVVTYGPTTAVDRVDLDVPPTTGRRIARIRVQADDAVSEVTVPADGRVTAEFPGRSAERLTLTVTFRVGTDPDLAQVQVQNRVSQALPRLPEEVRQLGAALLVVHARHDPAGLVHRQVHELGVGDDPRAEL